jgi:hypothetical protein
MVDGVFNVNSTSVDAWASLLGSLSQEKLLVQWSGENDSKTQIGGTEDIYVRSEQIQIDGSPSAKDFENIPVLQTSVSSSPPADEFSSNHAKGSYLWRGMRSLTLEQIRKLAEEVVVQVKKRGPFLNLGEFINRRVENSELGDKGALQAAIDNTDINIQFCVLEGISLCSVRSVVATNLTRRPTIRSLPVSLPL